jgi:hypothetical protein
VAQKPPSYPANPLIVPAGTTLSVVLTQQISSSDTHPGTQIHAQLVSPVVSGSQVAIPAGTYLEGQVSKINQQSDVTSLSLHSASLAFVNGYVAQLPGIVTVQSAEGWWSPAPSSRRGAALLPFLLAPAIGGAIGAAVGKDGSVTPGSITNGQLVPGSITPSTRGRDAGIGVGIGAAVMFVGLATYFHLRHHGAPDFFFPDGAPMQVVLASPLSLDAAQTADAASQSPQTIQPVAQRPAAPVPDTTPTGICYAPDTPGTPPTIIPGIPATPNSPGTPDIVIPGTPSTPGGVIPCS